MDVVRDDLADITHSLQGDDGHVVSIHHKEVRIAVLVFLFQAGELTLKEL